MYLWTCKILSCRLREMNELDCCRVWVSPLRSSWHPLASWTALRSSHYSRQSQVSILFFPIWNYMCLLYNNKYCSCYLRGFNEYLFHHRSTPRRWSVWLPWLCFLHHQSHHYTNQVPWSSFQGVWCSVWHSTAWEVQFICLVWVQEKIENENWRVFHTVSWMHKLRRSLPTWPYICTELRSHVDGRPEDTQPPFPETVATVVMPDLLGVTIRVTGLTKNSQKRIHIPTGGLDDAQQGSVSVMTCQLFSFPYFKM